MNYFQLMGSCLWPGSFGLYLRGFEVNYGHSMKPVALIISRNLPPLVGGMERLVWHVVDALMQDSRVHVIGPEGCTPHLPTGVTVSEISIKPLWWFFARVKGAAIVQAMRLRPNLVFAGSGPTAPCAWLAARLTGAKCVVYLHGLDIEAQNRVYRLLWRPFFKYFDRVLVNSRFTRNLALEADIPDARIRILHPGVELPNLSLASKHRHDFRVEHQLWDEPVLLYVGRITERKGLLPFVQNILPCILFAKPNMRLIVIGREPRWALRRENSQCAQIQKILIDQGWVNSVQFLGGISDEELSVAYFASDALVFPVQQKPGDNEGFGMVAIEAAAHGLPTVAFDSGGIGDAVSDGVSGRLISAGNYAAFTAAVLELLDRPLPSEKSQTFAAQFAWEMFNKKLQKYLQSLV